ncbi:DUF3102 domain-containing protein [Ancylobacter amanitiformis]|uniref:DUF3102 domain-containing protein n=1 Tax=Ancylobacter amanitiformis TaxID=217069 RepID=A0ABU0LPJ0_9HYPH|nr:DUF3102 domain-containing protein [Ancylobacter amanitiformis]MDQ0510625.1 hypothetical protein [Ancylobacter amanitiformis]
MNNLEISSTVPVPVIDLPFLAREINDAHRQVQFHGKSMLMEAKRAGEALLEAKRSCIHGEFKKWVADNCAFSYQTAVRYMRVAKKITHDSFEQGDSLNAFLDAHSTPRQPEPSTTRSFTREDAERALKFHALATRGATEAEQKAASGKLASFAKEFGMTPEATVARAREFLPDAEKTDFQRAADEVKKRNAEREAQFSREREEWAAREAEREAAFQREAKERDARAEKQAATIRELHEKVRQMSARREELFKDLRGKSKEELLDLLVSAQLQLEGFGA